MLETGYITWPVGLLPLCLLLYVYTLEFYRNVNSIAFILDYSGSGDTVFT